MENTSTYSIRKAHPFDYQTVKALLDLYQLPSQDLPTKLDHFLVSIEEQKVIGTVGLELYGPFALVRSLAVRPRLQGKGMGKGLYQAAEQIAKKNGVEHLYLLTTTAEVFFQQQGFKLVERTAVPAPIRQSRQFGGICPATATVLLKSLNW